MDLKNIFKDYWFTKKEMMMAEKDSSLRRKELSSEEQIVWIPLSLLPFRVTEISSR